MRARFVVVALAFVSGCSQNEPAPVVTVAPEETALPQPTQNVISVARDSAASQPRPRTRRLVFECANNIRFAVESTGGGRLAVFPPGFPTNSYLSLGPVPSPGGLHFRAGDTDLWMHDDLATLHVGRERYVECVSNPAAAAWEVPPLVDATREDLARRLRTVEQH
jgi:hypothetical protein